MCLQCIPGMETWFFSRGIQHIRTSLFEGLSLNRSTSHLLMAHEIKRRDLPIGHEPENSMVFN